MVRVQVLYFAKAREAVGISEESVDIADGATTDDLRAHLIASHPPLESVFGSCVMALNQEYVTEVQSLKERDEIAVIPPISGG